MSGGAYEYLCYKVEDFASSMRGDDNPRREAFRNLLKLVSKAMHDIEWVDSSDMSKGDENAAIDKVFEFLKHEPSLVYKATAFDKIAKLVGKEPK